MEIKVKQFFLLSAFIVIALADIKFDGNWGDWQGDNFAPAGYYLCGANMRFEKSQGDGDDTATNGFIFKFCKLSNWASQYSMQFSGLWGDWKGWQMCPTGYFVNGFQVRFEKSQGDGDDTALNGLKIQCINLQFSKSVVTVYDGNWGDWRDWIVIQNSNEFINGYNIRFQSSRGKGDDTALNGINFKTKRLLATNMSIQYTLPTTVNLQPRVLSSQKITNWGERDTQNVITVSKEVTTIRKWENSNRVLLGLQVTASFGVPDIASGQITTSYEYEKTITFGQQESETERIEKSFTVLCPSCRLCTVTISLKESTQDIPYSANITLETNDVLKVTGVYKGVMFSQAQYTVNSTVLSNCTSSSSHKHLAQFR